jgi:hypothetical protein
MFKISENTAPFHHSNTTHLETLLKFLALVVTLVAYFGYMAYKYDAATGFGLAVLSWSFFVLCTPIADGGFILAFPVRLLFGIKMAITQIIVWFLAISVNGYMLWAQPETYDLSLITQILHRILVEPWPYWSILIVSALGTILSIYFGDEMMDVTQHHERKKHHAHGFKYRIILVVGLGLLTVIAYYELLSTLHLDISE